LFLPLFQGVSNCFFVGVIIFTYKLLYVYILERFFQGFPSIVVSGKKTKARALIFGEVLGERV